jgi:hypothetical protein
MQYVAWIDILGTRDLIFDSNRRSEATKLLSDFETSVHGVLSSLGNGFSVYGVNDGFYMVAYRIRVIDIACAAGSPRFQMIYFNVHATGFVAVAAMTVAPKQNAGFNLFGKVLTGAVRMGFLHHSYVSAHIDFVK